MSGAHGAGRLIKRRPWGLISTIHGTQYATVSIASDPTRKLSAPARKYTSLRGRQRLGNEPDQLADTEADQCTGLEESRD